MNSMVVQKLQPLIHIFLPFSVYQEMKEGMPFAYNLALAAAQSLVECASRFCEDPLSDEAKESLITAAQGVLEGTMKVRDLPILTL